MTCFVYKGYNFNYLISLPKIAKKRGIAGLTCDNAQLLKSMFVYSALNLKL